MKPQIIQDSQSQRRTTGQRISSCKQGKGSLIPKTISKALKQRLEYETNNNYMEYQRITNGTIQWALSKLN